MSSARPSRCQGPDGIAGVVGAPLGTRVLVGSPFANLGDGATYVYDCDYYSKSGRTQSQELVQSDRRPRRLDLAAD
jgi:hypothetical protein